jgi:hypothetical protein
MGSRAFIAVIGVGAAALTVAAGASMRIDDKRSVSPGTVDRAMSAAQVRDATVVALPGQPTALIVGAETSNAGLSVLRVAHRGGISTLAPLGDGRARLTETTALPAIVEPVALGEKRTLTLDPPSIFVLDRASDSVLVLRRDGGHRLIVAATLAVGSRPSALVLDDFNLDQHTDVAVANEGSGDVSVLLADATGRYGQQRRVAVGTAPRALTVGEFDHRDGADIAVANFGSDTVTILGGDDAGHFTRRGDITAGSGPVAFTSSEYDGRDPLDLDYDGAQDLVVADAKDGTVAVLLGTSRLPRLAARHSLPGGATSDPVALAHASGLGDDRDHVLVAARGSGAVIDFTVADSGELQPPVTFLMGGRPNGIALGAFGADLTQNVAVADASGVVRIVVAAGSRVVDAARHLSAVAAGGGVVAWSSRRAAHNYRLRSEDASGARSLPVPSSRRPFEPRVGRAADGTPVITYRRCGARDCTPFAWSATRRRARRLQIAVPPGCTVLDVAMWRTTLAHLIGPGQRGDCPRSARGLWVTARGRGARRVSAAATRLGDLRGRQVSWFEDVDEGDTGRIRVSALPGRPRTVFDWDLETGPLSNGLLDGRFLYWTQAGRYSDTATLLRAPVKTVSACQILEPDNTFADPGADLGPRQVAIDGTHLLYLNGNGVFETILKPEQWRSCQ